MHSTGQYTLRQCILCNVLPFRCVILLFLLIFETKMKKCVKNGFPHAFVFGENVNYCSKNTVLNTPQLSIGLLHKPSLSMGGFWEGLPLGSFRQTPCVRGKLTRSLFLDRQKEWRSDPHPSPPTTMEGGQSLFDFVFLDLPIWFG